MREIVASTEIYSSGYAAVPLRIGKTGENLATVVLFQVADWISTFGSGGTFKLAMRAPDGTYYESDPDCETYGEYVAWTVQLRDLQIPGHGMVELSYWMDDALAKSETYITVIEPAL